MRNVNHEYAEIIRLLQNADVRFFVHSVAVILPASSYMADEVQLDPGGYVVHLLSNNDVFRIHRSIDIAAIAGLEVCLRNQRLNDYPDIPRSAVPRTQLAMIADYFAEHGSAEGQPMLDTPIGKD